jgi:hypothetical protein
LERAEAIIDVQKKLASLFGQTRAETRKDERE